MSTKSRVEDLEDRVEKLEAMLNKDITEGLEPSTWFPYFKRVDVPTVSGRVNAIIDFLGIDISVDQEKHVKSKVVIKERQVKEVTPAKKRKYVKSGKYTKKSK